MLSVTQLLLSVALLCSPLVSGACVLAVSGSLWALERLGSSWGGEGRAWKPGAAAAERRTGAENPPPAWPLVPTPAQEDSTPDYLGKAEGCIHEEEARVSSYLHQQTKPKLLKEVRRRPPVAPANGAAAWIGALLRLLRLLRLLGDGGDTRIYCCWGEG